MFQSITNNEREWELSLPDIGIAYRGNFYIPAFDDSDFEPGNKDETYINSFYYSLNDNVIYRLYCHRENYKVIIDYRTKELPSKKELLMYKLTNTKLPEPPLKKSSSFSSYISCIESKRYKKQIFDTMCYGGYNV